MSRRTYVIAGAVLLLIGAPATWAARPSTSPVAVATPSASAAAPTATASPSASPSSGLVTYESPILGHRITLPAAYRRVGSTIVTGQELLGRDTYTLLTAAEERAECLTDKHDIPSPSSAAYLFIEAYRSLAGLSPVEWVNTPRTQGGFVMSTHQTVESVTIDGRPAARLANVSAGGTSAYVMGANERMYVITPTMWPAPHRLDGVAATFRAIETQPFPTPTASPQVPGDGARQLGQALATAFAARDANAIGSLITTQCSIGFSAVVEPLQAGGYNCCVVNAAVEPFMQRLRDRFAAGDLTVTVDPAVQVIPQGSFVRSTWRYPDQTVRIDLNFREVDGRWEWIGALHHYQRAELINSCVRYGTPWVPPNSSWSS